MLGLVCPHCGRPTPVSLASAERFACEACGHAGQTPEPVRSHLLAARAVLERLEVRERQISKSQAFAYDEQYTKLVVCLRIILFACGGFEAFATAASIANHGVEDWVHATGPAIGFVACLATAMVTLALMRRGGRRLEESFAAWSRAPSPLACSGSCPP